MCDFSSTLNCFPNMILCFVFSAMLTLLSNVRLFLLCYFFCARDRCKRKNSGFKNREGHLACTLLFQRRPHDKSLEKCLCNILCRQNHAKMYYEGEEHENKCVFSRLSLFYFKVCLSWPWAFSESQRIRNFHFNFWNCLLYSGIPIYWTINFGAYEYLH